MAVFDGTTAAIQEIRPIADRYISKNGYLSEDTINLIYEFVERMCEGYDPVLHMSVIKNILEDAVDEALDLFA